jgi:hypothetical protein
VDRVVHGPPCRFGPKCSTPHHLAVDYVGLAATVLKDYEDATLARKQIFRPHKQDQLQVIDHGITTRCAGAAEATRCSHARSSSVVQLRGHVLGIFINFLPLFWMSTPDIAFLGLALHVSSRKRNSIQKCHFCSRGMPTPHSSMDPSHQPHAK